MTKCQSVNRFNSVRQCQIYDGEFEVEFGKSPVVVKATAKSLFFLFRIAKEYNLKKQHQKIISSLKTMRKASKESEMTKSNLNASVKIIDHFLNKMAKF